MLRQYYKTSKNKDKTRHPRIFLLKAKQLNTRILKPLFMDATESGYRGRGKPYKRTQQISNDFNYPDKIKVKERNLKKARKQR